MSFDGILLTVLAVLAGLFAGFARRGRVLAMASTDVRAKSLLVVGIAVPALAEQFTRDVAVPLVLGGMTALFVFALANVRIAGMSVLAIGVLVNAVPTLLNGGLPVRPQALVDAGIVQADELDRVEVRGARRLEEPTQQLRFLGDVIPLPETSQVLSFGDLIVLVGLADVTANLTLARRRRRAGSAGPAAELSGHAPGDDDDPYALPPIDEMLHRAVRSHVDAGRPYDPRPLPRHRVPDTGATLASALASVLRAETPVVPGRDLAWTLGPELEEGDAETPVDVVLAGVAADPPTGIDLFGPEVAWWTPDDPPPPLPAPPLPAVGLDAAPDLPFEPTAPAEAELAEAELAEAELAETELVETELVEPVLDLPAAEVEVALVETPVHPPVTPEIDLVAHEAPAPRRAIVVDRLDLDQLDLVTLATADPDELFRAIVGDLAPRRRARRRSGRHIPDFEPIHLDDEPARRG
jgi:hypothetical protein